MHRHAYVPCQRGKIMAHRIKDIFIALLLIAVGGIGVYLYEHHTASHAPAPVSTDTEQTVDVLTVKTQPVTVENTYIGYVMPIHSIAVLPMIAGYVEHVLVTGGQDVTAGQPLFTLRPGEYQADLDSAQAKVLQAEATLANAQTYYDRLVNAGAKAVSKTDLDNAKTSLLSAKADVASAVAAQHLAEINLGYTRISATISGTIGDVEISPGDYVSPSGTALVTIIQTTPIRVVFAISDKEYLTQKAAPGRPFDDWTLRLQLANGAFFDGTGQVQFFNNEVTPQTSSVNVYADFDNPNKELLSGAYVSVVMQKKINAAVLIPQRLVHLDPKGAFVYTVQNGHMAQTPVTIGPAVGTDFVIENGLNPGDLVINQTMITFDSSTPLRTNAK